MSGLPEVELWADGSGTTRGPIGFAWVLLHPATGRVREGHAGAVEGTNNRAELLSVIHGLRAIKRCCRVLVVTDSEYVAKPFRSGWIDVWKGKQWRKIKNSDLWLELDGLVARHQVSWRWVPGHTGYPLNEDCDRRAGQCRRSIVEALASGVSLGALPFDVVDRPQGEQLGLPMVGGRA